MGSHISMAPMASRVPGGEEEEGLEQAFIRLSFPLGTQGGYRQSPTNREETEAQ